MIKLNDIKESIIKLIFDSLGDSYTYYDEEIPQNFNRPSFFIDLLPNFYNRNNDYHVDKSILCSIYYFSENKKNIEKYDMTDSLSELIGNTIEINDRIITIVDFNPEFNEDILQFQFTLNFLDALEDKEKYDLMEHLILNYESKRLNTNNLEGFNTDENEEVYVLGSSGFIKT